MQSGTGLKSRAGGGRTFMLPVNAFSGSAMPSSGHVAPGTAHTTRPSASHTTSTSAMAVASRLVPLAKGGSSSGLSALAQARSSSTALEPPASICQRPAIVASISPGLAKW